MQISWCEQDILILFIYSSPYKKEASSSIITLRTRGTQRLFSVHLSTTKCAAKSLSLENHILPRISRQATTEISYLPEKYVYFS